jgi:hypothetical protein
MKRMIWLVVTTGIWATGCTSLGPMPTTTGLAAVPAGRPGVEVQAGLVPGYHVSAATQEPTHKGDPISQVLGLLEPDQWLGTHGLVVGARHWGEHDDNAIEPFLGYRHRLDDNFAIGLFGYGTTMAATDHGASYHATRIGGELAVDARVIAVTRWLALHGQAAISTTYLDAHGTYCADSNGLGVDCNQDGTDRMVDGSIHGAFTSATAALALDFGRLSDGAFHSLRVALLGSAGVMPQVRDGKETDGARYASLGLSLTIGFGAQ